ncbi:MAG: hypothetical protein GY716_19485 [bacterium]|nr:hypothetical protein [bacterium]
MAVYERTYKEYAGTLTPERTRFLVLPSYAFQEVFRSKMFASFLILCFVPPLIEALLIYLPHNVSLIERWEALTGTKPPFTERGAQWFLTFSMIQGWMAGIVAFVLGPALISADLRNNGLPLYFARPFTKTEYVLGKTTILIVLLSAVTWIPGFVCFLLQAYLAEGWLVEHWKIGIALLLSNGILILLLCLISLALSAYVKWKPIARLSLLAIMFAGPPLGGMFTLMLRSEWGHVIDLPVMVVTVWASLYGLESPTAVPAWGAWLSLLTACGICLLLLARKIRAYEVVR